MRLELDKIMFEDRDEIRAIIKALEEHQATHEKNDTVQELISKLDAMDMTW